MANLQQIPDGNPLDTILALARVSGEAWSKQVRELEQSGLSVADRVTAATALWELAGQRRFSADVYVWSTLVKELGNADVSRRSDVEPLLREATRMSREVSETALEQLLNLKWYLSPPAPQNPPEHLRAAANEAVARLVKELGTKPDRSGERAKHAEQRPSNEGHSASADSLVRLCAHSTADFQAILSATLPYVDYGLRDRPEQIRPHPAALQRFWETHDFMSHSLAAMRETAMSSAVRSEAAVRSILLAECRLAEGLGNAIHSEQFTLASGANPWGWAHDIIRASNGAVEYAAYRRIATSTRLAVFSAPAGGNSLAAIFDAMKGEKENDPVPPGAFLQVIGERNSALRDELYTSAKLVEAKQGFYGKSAPIFALLKDHGTDLDAIDFRLLVEAAVACVRDVDESHLSHERVEELSGGVRRRLAATTAALLQNPSTHPELPVLDEYARYVRYHALAALLGPVSGSVADDLAPIVSTADEEMAHRICEVIKRTPVVRTACLELMSRPEASTVVLAAATQVLAKSMPPTAIAAWAKENSAHEERVLAAFQSGIAQLVSEEGYVNERVSKIRELISIASDDSAPKVRAAALEAFAGLTTIPMIARFMTESFALPGVREAIIEHHGACRVRMMTPQAGAQDVAGALQAGAVVGYTPTVDLLVDRMERNPRLFKAYVAALIYGTLDRSSETLIFEVLAHGGQSTALDNHRPQSIRDYEHYLGYGIKYGETVRSACAMISSPEMRARIETVARRHASENAVARLRGLHVMDWDSLCTALSDLVSVSDTVSFRSNEADYTQSGFLEFAREAAAKSGSGWRRAFIGIWSSDGKICVKERR